jgi:hypothetical protein
LEEQEAGRRKRRSRGSHSLEFMTRGGNYAYLHYLREESNFFKSASLDVGSPSTNEGIAGKPPK